jgi:cytochrome P450
MEHVRELPYDERPVNQDLKHIDGDYGWPLVGRSLELLRDPFGLFRRYAERFGPVSRISMTGFNTVVLNHPDFAEIVLRDSDSNFSAKKGWEPHMAAFFEGGLVMRDFGEHRIHRRIVTSAFTRASMIQYAEQVQAICERTVKRWGEKGEILFYDEIKRLLLDIAFGVFCWVDERDKDVDRVNEAFSNMMEGSIGMIRLDVPGTSYHRGLKGRRFLKRYFLEQIERKRASDDQDAFAGFCRAHRDDGSYYSDEDVANHMIFLMLAAHDTTTSSATMAAYYLAHELDVQAALAREIAETPRPLEYDTIFGGMPTMLGVFYETLRLHPPVPMLLRRSLRECQIGGVRIPADTMVCVPIMAIQRLPDFWENPDTFDPRRFAEGAHDPHVHPFKWIPFGAGAHKCIGLLFARLLFSHLYGELLSRYELQFARPSYFPTKLQHFPFAKPVDRLPVKLVPRESAP